MSDQLMAVVIVTVIFVSVSYVIKSLSDNWLRRKLVESGHLDENVKFLYQQGAQTPASLKWGMALIAVGAAVLVGQLAPYDVEEEITISAMFIFPGVALVVYYFVSRKFAKNSAE